MAEPQRLRVLSVRARGGPDAAGAALAAAGLELPSAPNHFSGDAARACAWIEPHAWLVLSQAPIAIAAPAGALVTDVSDRFAAFQLSGPRAREILEAALSIGARPSVLAPGRCGRARFGEEIEVFVQQLSGAPEYRLLCDVSFERYAAAFLADAGALL